MAVTFQSPRQKSLAVTFDCQMFCCTVPRWCETRIEAKKQIPLCLAWPSFSETAIEAKSSGSFFLGSSKILEQELQQAPRIFVSLVLQPHLGMIESKSSGRFLLASSKNLETEIEAKISGGCYLPEPCLPPGQPLQII